MKRRAIRTAFRGVAAFVVLTVIVLAAVLCFEPGREKSLPRPEACPVVSNVIDTIVHVFSGDCGFVRMDVRKLSCREFADSLRGFPDAAVLWTPGEGDWLIVGVEHGCSNTLEKVLDAFAGEETVYSFPEVFANCVGTIGEIRPAFETVDPDDGVVPELFVAKEVPGFGWLTDGEVDADLAKKIRQEMRSMQVVRRMVLEGDMLSRQQDEDAAIAKWTAAFRRAPNDTLLLERMDHLRRNAEVFYKVGKYGMASKCYETLLRIKPEDYVAAMNLAECLKRLGKRELSQAVLRKAETLRPKEASSGKM